VDNEAADGLTSDGLRQQVVAQGIAARPAQVTVITIGANDFDASVLSGPGCTAAADVGCYQPTLTAMGAHLDALLTALAAAPGPHGPTLVTGYWNVFLDGAVGAAQGTAYVRDSDALTRAVNAVLQARATQDAATYVDLYTPFKGDGDRDDTGLLAADGDHPSAAGHALIARVLRQALTASA
jgi:lysophospholipase L1-like esterase